MWKKKDLKKRAVHKQYAKMQKYRYIKQNPKVICPYDLLRARTLRARHKSLRVRYVHSYELSHNFLRPVLVKHIMSDDIVWCDPFLDLTDMTQLFLISVTDLLTSANVIHKLPKIFQNNLDPIWLKLTFMLI